MGRVAGQRKKEEVTLMFRMQQLGATAFGGAVTVAEWWDKKRIDEGKITNKDVIKKAGFWAFVGLGGLATLISVTGWWRRYEPWMEALSTGFFYDIPRVVYNTAKALGTTSTTTSSRAIEEANAIAARARAQARRQLGAGTPAGRSWEPEMTKSGAFAW